MKTDKKYLTIVVVLIMLVAVFAGTLIYLLQENSNRSQNESPINENTNTEIIENTEIEELPEGVEYFTSDTNIIQTGDTIPEISTFIEQLKTTNFAEQLTDGGEYTILAPANEAITNTLSESSIGLHIIKGSFPNESITEGLVLETLNGTTLDVVRQENGFLVIQGPSNNISLLVVNFNSQNGIIHMVDGVLIP